MGSQEPGALFVALMVGSMVAFQIHTRSWRHSGICHLVWLAGAVLVGLALFAPAATKIAPGLSWGVLAGT